MQGKKELTSEELRDLYCAPENTDNLESIDFDDEDENEETHSNEEKYEIYRARQEAEDFLCNAPVTDEATARQRNVTGNSGVYIVKDYAAYEAAVYAFHEKKWEDKAKRQEEEGEFFDVVEFEEEWGEDDLDIFLKKHGIETVPASAPQEQEETDYSRFEEYEPITKQFNDELSKRRDGYDAHISHLVAELLKEANKKIKGFGVEGILDEEHGVDVQYVNMGDTNNLTILYDGNNKKFSTSTLGDIVKKHDMTIESAQDAAIRLWFYR